MADSGQRVRLRVQAGPDAGSGLLVGASPITIGRGDDRDLRLSDGAVSRHHLTLSSAVGADGEPILRVEELRGQNPVWTIVDGERVVLAAGQTLRRGQTFTVGNTSIAIVADADETGPARVREGGSSTLEMDCASPPGARPLAALAALGERLARSGSVQGVFRESTDWLTHVLPASRALLLGADGKDVLGAAGETALADVAVPRGLLERALRERRAFLVRDVLHERDLADRRSVQSRGIVGALVVPVAGLVLYAEWGSTLALSHAYGEDSLLLGVCAAHLVDALGRNAAERQQLRTAARSRPGAEAPRMIGGSGAIQRLHVFLERVAATETTVLLVGESGTGKELAARTIHASSARADGPFVALNCGAIPAGLLETELFGHERGAFTGAVAKHEGVFARAQGGTLFLDEIGELGLPTQAAMLRVLENRTLTPVGGAREVAIDVRIVAATHRDLAKMVGQGTFREDLFYRLSVIQTRMPPLRERTEDLVELVQHFVDALGQSMGRRVVGVAPEVHAALARYPWPGNVRELRNVVERALVLGDGPVLELDDLPPELVAGGIASPSPSAGAVPVRTLAELERETIAAALAATAGNKARAAALLGIDRTTLYRKLKELDPS